MRRQGLELRWGANEDSRWAPAPAGRIDQPASAIAMSAAISCLAVVALLWMAPPADAAVRIKGPAKVRVGQQVTFRASGLDAHEQFTVNLAPTRHRGGNCCGVDVDEGHADVDGVAVLRFRWPTYYRNGNRRVRWRDGARADVIVFGDAGRGIRVVRVRR